ncbi:recombinase family protein [Methylocapsa sp. D3K7]|uniref:recombinase family protein n=1 Tax=Methylocapsa sp. D3K7 TaxID=3041435 RepID=UPI00244EE465|nr:recombinase family protein [Methylocapsa sp. D3K7]WGJ16361.1 recombinase family protein [Methylocapsa sp. D3K7]
MRKPDRPKSSQNVRCAVYTRKSSEDGLEQGFNSLAAQREACEAYVTSQRHAGWVALPDMYDDGGLSPAARWSARPCSGSSLMSKRAKSRSSSSTRLTA